MMTKILLNNIFLLYGNFQWYNNNNMNNDNSPQRSALQNLIAQNDRMRDQMAQLRREKDQLHRHLMKAEGEIRRLDLKLTTIQAERQRDLNQNRRFMESLEQQKREKVKLLTGSTQLKNATARIEAEIASLKSQNSVLESQNQRLLKQAESASLSQVAALRDRQASLNSVKLLETKLEAAQMEKKFLGNKVVQLQNEVLRTKQQLAVMTKKYHEKQVGVQAIYRDEQATKERLLGQFQNKITDKDLEMRQELQKYLNENSFLKQQIIELKAGLR